MKKWFLSLLVVLPLFRGLAQIPTKHHFNTSLEKIVIGDPFIYADADTKLYYMVGTTGVFGKMWVSKDLKMWAGPYDYFRLNEGSWLKTSSKIWAPEIHKYRNKYYCFATFTNYNFTHIGKNGKHLPRRNTHILISDNPSGPFVEFTTQNYTSPDKCTIDGTLWVDQQGVPYMVYCYEWIQAEDGRIEAVKLGKKLNKSKGGEFILFKASNGKWNNNVITDGPFLFRTKTGKLGMLWSTFSNGNYVQGIAYAENGNLFGPWIQESEPLTPNDFGHGMIFTSFDGKLLLVCHGWHYDNKGNKGNRYPVFFELDDSYDKLKLIGRYNP